MRSRPDPRAQRDYFRDEDAAHFAWQTGAPIIAESEAELIATVDARPGDRLLEIGCGEGANLHHLRARVADLDLYALDSSSDKARHCARANHARAVRGDAQALPFEDGSFDAVLIRDLLHHVPDRALALAEAARVLKPGGRLTVIEPSRSNPIIAAMATAIPAERGMLSSTAERTAAEVAEAGLAVVSVERRHPMPIARALLHYKHGAPRLGDFSLARRVFRFVDAACRMLPGGMWAYHVVRAVRPAS